MLRSAEHFTGQLVKIVSLCPTSAHYREEQRRSYWTGAIVEIVHATYSDEITRSGYPNHLSITFRGTRGWMKGKIGCIYGAKLELLSNEPQWEV